jgi:hypothetical protein
LPHGWQHYDEQELKAAEGRLLPVEGPVDSVSCPVREQQMEYLIGLMLALAVVGSASVIGFDREHAFYPTVLIVIASYYVLFAVVGASSRTLAIEIVVASGFLLLAVLGFKKDPWIVAAALAGHGVFDFVHRFFVDNPGVPHWWPGFCLAFDGLAAMWLAALLMRRRRGD